MSFQCRKRRNLVLAMVFCAGAYASAGDFSQKGYFESYLRAFPQVTANDRGYVVADSLFRYEPSYTNKSKLSFFASIDAEIDSHHQVARDLEYSWWDRTERRSIFNVRRLSAIYRKQAVTVELGKQFIRWGK